MDFGEGYFLTGMNMKMKEEWREKVEDRLKRLEVFLGISLIPTEWNITLKKIDSIQRRTGFSSSLIRGKLILNKGIWKEEEEGKRE
jgi:hypothetical protein